MKQKSIIPIALLTMAIVLLAGCSLGTSEAPSTIPIRNPYVSVQPLSYAYVIGGTPAYTESPKLEIDIYDWDEENGELALQWYTFDSIEEYYQTGGGTRLDGVTGFEYQVPPLTPEANKRHYYYVQITNTNDTTAEKVVTINSELAVLSFRNNGDPVIPVVTRQPVSGRYQFGRAIGGIKVTADAQGAGLTYQWYSLEEIADFSFDLEKATLIEGATQASFMPDIELLSAGANYFFVKVTNPTGKGSEEYSLPVTIEMLLGDKAFAPRIEEQPRGQLAFTGEPVEPLSVTAISLDSGRLSYQWYSNTKNAIGEATLIEGATGETYQPDITTGTQYYYVTVTNTNNNVAPVIDKEGNEDKAATEANRIATLNSKVVKVSIGTSGAPNANATINIPDPNGMTGSTPNKFNYVRGYGGMEIIWGNFWEHTEADMELMYNPDQLGYNIMRVMIHPANTNMELNMEDAVGRRPRYYDNVKIVNKYGGYVLASPWSPPKEWKSNNSINGGGYLIPSYYKLYAAYLKAYAQHMYDKGAPIYAVSIQNEPNYVAGYDGCEWEPDQMRDFFKEVGHFTDGVRGYGGGRETAVVLTVNGESANTPNINLAALNDPVSNAAIDLLARHVYGEQTVNLWETPTRNGKEVWMTEHNINSANAIAYPNDSRWNYLWRFMNDVDLVMRLNNENAFVWWASKRFYSMIGEGQYGTDDGAPLIRGYGLAHYSKFTIDMTRIHWTIGAGSTTADGTPIPNINRATSVVNATTFSLDNTSPRITAYISEDGNELSLVMWTPTMVSGSGGYDMGTIKINMPPDFEIRGAYAVRSTAPVQGGASTMMLEDDVVISPDRKSAYVTLPNSQMLSVKFTR